LIPYGKHIIAKEDIDAVNQVLKSDFLTQGPMVPAFEEKLKSTFGAKYAVAVNSATSALHIACLALGVSENDIVWTSAITFVASANCALYCGAKIDFVDIDEKTFNMSIDDLEDKLEKAKKLGKLPKVIIPVHFAGNPCEIQTISRLSRKYGFKIIEDASHAIGSSYCVNNENIKIGSCKHSDITIFSFHPVKIITSAEGGAALTNNQSIARKMELLRTHGITFDRDEFSKVNDKEIWNYQQTELGFNYRLSDIHAALGLSQIDKVQIYTQKRNAIAKSYIESFMESNIGFQYVKKNNFSSYHLFTIKFDCIKNNQKEIYKIARANNIGVNLHYIPVYLHPYFRRIGFQKGYCPNAEAFYHSTITIPLFPSLKKEDQIKVIDIIKKAVF